MYDNIPCFLSLFQRHVLLILVLDQIVNVCPRHQHACINAFLNPLSSFFPYRIANVQRIRAWVYFSEDAAQIFVNIVDKNRLIH